MSKGSRERDKEISDSSYIEMLKNCSKWNSRVMGGKSRSRTALYNQQTGIIHRPTEYLFRHPSERIRAQNPMQVYVYPPIRWVKSKNIPSAAIEVNYFMKVNPALKDAINVKTDPNQLQATNDMASEQQFPTGNTPVRLAATTSVPKNYDNDMDLVEYDLDEPDFNDQSDEEDWGASRKKRKKTAAGSMATSSRSTRKQPQQQNIGGAAISNTTPIAVKIPKTDVDSIGGTPTSSTGTPGAPASEPRLFVCQVCGAKYKSRPGLTYHKIHVHQAESNNETPKSPSTPVSYTHI